MERLQFLAQVQMDEINHVQVRNESYIAKPLLHLSSLITSQKYNVFYTLLT